ncbi:MAG: DUF7305 domain-containing protein [Planctomycetota bacterium]
MKKLLKSRKIGSALTLVLLVLVIFLTVGAGFLSLGEHSRMLAIENISEISARAAADAGLVKALFEMNEKLKVGPWVDSGLPHAINEGLAGSDATLSYTVTGDFDSGYTIESIGGAGPVQRQVRATLRMQSIFDYGILTQGTLNLFKDNIVDGYNSDDPNDTDNDLMIGTTSTDHWALNIYGATIDGDVKQPVDFDFPDITAPDLPYYGTLIEAQDATVVVFGPVDNGVYSGIELKTGAILQIDGADVVLHITGDIWLGQGCEIVIKPGSSLTIYLDGNLIAQNSNGINNETMIPSKFVLYGTGEEQKFDLKAKSDFYGAVYAPNADTTVFSEGDVYGSVICSSFQMKQNCVFYYDEALRDAGLTTIGGIFVVDRWFEE